MINYCIQRLLATLLSTVFVSFIAFTLIHALPGGPIHDYLLRSQAQAQQTGEAVELTESLIAKIKSQHGLDRPLTLRYINWMKNLLSGDWGVSRLYNKNVLEIILSRLPVTLQLAILSLFLVVILGVGAGMILSCRPHWLVSAGLNSVLMALYCLPGFAIGICLLFLFAGSEGLQWFPLGGLNSHIFESYVLNRLHSLILPSMALASGSLAFLAVFTQASIKEELSKSYSSVALSKGLSFWRLIRRHILPNISGLLLTNLLLVFQAFAVGAVLTEKVFAIPGLGSLSLEAFISRDYDLIMGLLILTSIVSILVRLILDVLYQLLDPRVSLIGGDR